MICKIEKLYSVKFRPLLPNGKFWRKIQTTSLVVKSDIGPEKAMRRTEKLVAKQSLVIKAIAAEYLGEVKWSAPQKLNQKL